MQIENPYAGIDAAGEWVRGNLHAHTIHSDGERDRQSVIDHYAAEGYGFLALTDHDVLTTAGEYAELSDRGLVLLPGNEISADGPHLLHVDAGERIEPDPDRQAVIDDARRSGFVVVNHPNWQEGFDHCPQAELERWEGYRGIEIYNGVVESLPGSARATDRWDQLLARGRRVWGFANDDSHGPATVGMAANVAYVGERTREAVMEALSSGRFYASTGVEITAVHDRGSEVTVRAADAERIVAIRDHGVRFAAADGNSLAVAVPEGASYVRFECHGRGEAAAWTQPLFVEG